MRTVLGVVIKRVAVFSVGFKNVQLDIRHVQVPSQDNSEVYSERNAER